MFYYEMNERLQLALEKQIRRQILNIQRRENKILYMSLRHRIEKQNLINNHFEDLESKIIHSFDNYYKDICRSIELNRQRFDLSLDYNISEFQSEPRKDVVKIDEIMMPSSLNEYLFFKSLYPSSSVSSCNNNDVFYMCVGVMIIAYSLINQI